MLTGVQDPPSEPKATCGDCVMCGGVERSHSQIRFSPDVKCCSYVPHLANFLAGRSLLGPGHASITARIERRAGVTPLGLGLSQADIRRIVGAQSHFGRSAAVVCPHFLQDTQGCGIWQTRNAVCSTWFCKHERGAVSQAFWQAVRNLLMAVEERLAHRCLIIGGLPEHQISAVVSHRAAVRETIAHANAGAALPEPANDDAASAWYEQMWGDWAGREHEWFIGTAQAVASLSDDEFLASMHDAEHLAHLAHLVRDRRDGLMTHRLPDRLVFKPGTGSEATPDVLRLVGYSPFDPLVLPAHLLPALQRLGDRTPSQVRDEIDPHNALIDDDLLGRLLDFGVAE